MKVKIKHVDGVTDVIAKGFINDKNEFIAEYKHDKMTYGVIIPMPKEKNTSDFYSEIQSSNERVFYAKLIKEYSSHEVGRIYRISKFHDNTLYSCDHRGTGQGGYVSNVINTHFEKSTKEEYDLQNYSDAN